MPLQTAKPNRIGRPAELRHRAWLVHTYTATGAVLAFIAAWAVVHGSDRLALGAMFVATIVDATDGVLARRARVKEVLPGVDGARIDDIVDYLTFVFVPMLLLEAAGGLHQTVALPVIALVLLSSMYGFVSPDAKSSDHFFTGFPSYWNVVTFYLLVARWPSDVNAAILAVCAVLVFVPIHYVYPSRTPAWSVVTNVAGAIWAGLMLLMLWQYPAVSQAAFFVSLAYPAYYLLLSFVLHFQARRRT